MRYPANYGFIPHTLSPDGDPLDAMVVARSPFVPGCVVRARPIGVLNLEDEHGGDEKLICVPVDTTFPYYSDVGERAGPARRSCFSRSSISSPTIRTSSPTNGCASGRGATPRKPSAVVVEAIERAKQQRPKSASNSRLCATILLMPAAHGEELRHGQIRTASISPAARPRSRSCASGYSKPQRRGGAPQAPARLSGACKHRRTAAARAIQSADLSPRR